MLKNEKTEDAGFYEKEAHLHEFQGIEIEQKLMFRLSL
jgi:hypothetical protein